MSPLPFINRFRFLALEVVPVPSSKSVSPPSESEGDSGRIGWYSDVFLFLAGDEGVEGLELELDDGLE